MEGGWWGWRFWVCAKTWCLMIVCLSLCCLHYWQLFCEGVSSGLQQLQGQDAGDSKIWAVQKEGDLCWRSHHWQNPAPEHCQIVCLERKEFKTWGEKGAAAVWGSDEQGQQAKILGLCEKKEYIVSKTGLKQNHQKLLHVSRWLTASLPGKRTEPLSNSACWDAFLKCLYMVETLRINMRS